MDNLNTHSVASLYETFEPAEAWLLAERLEVHHTPRHGSWLNMAEIELGVMSRQCLGDRIDDKAVLDERARAWAVSCNKERRRADWQFTAADARIKLKWLYPSIQK
ncbi:MAG: transposase [Phycisphaerales bacterium]|nr:transposase [Phycisphaerales bacterium]